MEGYEVLQDIGCGSFGRVCLARNKEHNQWVALKKISKGGRSEREIKSLRQECEIQKNLHHPNIIRMLDSFETEDSVVVVTEFAKGDLYKFLLTHKRLEIKEVQVIACHIVSALYFLHSHRILHRDIKPQNVLIGFDDKAKLCDFGFARTMGINTYMLTSIKGTPLYMAPEIVQEKPYDHNADLWSLGCILYELLVRTPPFFTTSLFQLVRKIKNENIIWPEYITGDCLSFLQGLLQKDPQERLTWPALLHHPFVRGRLYIDKSVEEFALTKALSPSQELAKEKQRQNLQRKLAGYSKLLVKTARKLEEAQKELKRCSEEGRAGVKTPLSSPAGMQINPIKLPRSGVNAGCPTQNHPNVYPDGKNLKVMFQNLNLNDKEIKQNTTDNIDDDQDGNSGASSCETMTSSSEFESDSEEGDDDTHTVIMEGRKHRKGSNSSNQDKRKGDKVNKLGSLENKSSDKPSSRTGGSDLLWKSGALFTLHSFGSEDKAINSDEWICFLNSTIMEVLENPKNLGDKHILTMLVAPLRNHLASTDVLERIAVLLGTPFIEEESFNKDPEYMSNLQTLYLDTKVLPNLLYACKLIVRRRRVERGSITVDDLPSLLNASDLIAVDMILKLASVLIILGGDFMTQFCDSICVLQAFPILQLFLKLNTVNAAITADTVFLLTHLLRISPSNISIIEEVLFDENENNSADQSCILWTLLEHSNPSVQSRSLRLFVYSCIDSEKIRAEFLGKGKSRLWQICKRATNSLNVEVRVAADLVLRSLCNDGTAIFTAKSNSTCQSCCRCQPATTGPVLSSAASGDAPSDVPKETNNQTPENGKTDPCKESNGNCNNSSGKELTPNEEVDTEETIDTTPNVTCVN